MYKDIKQEEREKEAWDERGGQWTVNMLPFQWKGKGKKRK